MYGIYWTNCLVTIPIRTLLDIEDVLDMMLLYRQTVFRCMDMCEYDTRDADVCDGTDFWRYYFQIFALMSLTDVLMTLSTLTTKYRCNIDFMSIEDVILSYDLD